DGNNWEASVGAPNFQLGFGVPASAQTVTPIPATDANRANMVRSFYWYTPNVTINAVPAGTYDVYVYVFEDNNPVTYSILLENIVVQSNYNSGPAGTWRKLGPFTATINDGNINVRSTTIDANFSGVEIWRAGQSAASSLRLAAAETVSESEESEANSDLSFYPNPFSNKATISYRTTQSAPSQLSVYDVRGVLVWSRQDENVDVGHIQQFELEDENLQNGVYILEFVNGIHIKRLKIIRSQ
ncbi:MAG TPA: T9SS type A sorting domain-containing protein, partial [Chryseolinea sp.]|nr:T9SS type A sorting domain-containing protein [Chryseolinea sp.]